MINVNRRTFLKASAVTTVGLGTVSTPVAAREPPMAQPILCEVDMNSRFDVVNHRVADPSSELCEGDAGPDNSERENVLHVTSNGNSTRDYSSGIVNLQDRFDDQLTLERVSSSGDVAYSYFEGPNNANAAPDEVFLIVRKGDSSTGASNETGLFAVYKTINDGVDPAPADVSCEEDNKRWRGVDVSAQLDGGDRQWAEIEIAREDVASGQMVIDTAVSIRDEGDRFESVLDRYGADSELVAVGYGKGNTRRGTTVDVYYDELVVRPDDADAVSVDFPAAVPMDVEFSPPQVNTAGGGTLNASLSLQQEEVGINLDDVQTDSVKLTPISVVAPPVEEGVPARSVNVTGQGLRAQFRTNAIADRFDAGEHRVLVSGQFENETNDAFLAEGTLTIRDPGRSILSSLL